MNPRLHHILSLVPGWSFGSVKVTPLEGGITNQNYRVDAGGESFVLRIAGEGTEILGIDRRREHEASRIAAGVGVGSEVVCFLEEEGALVTRFIEGAPIPRETAATPGMAARIAQSIRAYHSGPDFPGSFSPFDTVRAYHRLALERGVELPAGAPDALQALDGIERALGPGGKPVPCHNDLLAANFIDDGRRVRILDWEYAGMGDPFFDLGNFAANNRLDAAACEALLQAYAGGVSRQHLARIHLMRLASDMREAFWGFLQSGVSKLEFDFKAYAMEHLHRFEVNASSPEVVRWLIEVKE